MCMYACFYMYSGKYNLPLTQVKCSTTYIYLKSGNTAHRQTHTKRQTDKQTKQTSRDSKREKQLQLTVHVNQTAITIPYRLPLGDLGATYANHLRLVGKRVGDFLLVLTELFSLGRAAEALRTIIGSKSGILLQRGPVDPTFQIEKVAPTHHSSSQKTRLNSLSHGIKIWTDFSSVLSQCMRLTDRRTEISSL